MEDVRLRFPILLASTDVSPSVVLLCFRFVFSFSFAVRPHQATDHFCANGSTAAGSATHFSPSAVTSCESTQPSAQSSPTPHPNPRDQTPIRRASKKKQKQNGRKTHKRLHIDPHLGRRAIELHIVLANLATILHGLDARAQAVRFDGAVGQAGVGDEEQACAGGEGLLRGGLG